MKAKDRLLEFRTKSNLHTKAMKSLDSLAQQRIRKENLAFVIEKERHTVKQTYLLDEYA
ncbi:adenosine deaminase, partial [Staphylococcus pseudintermedius]